MGEDGYSLHQEIVSTGNENVAQSEQTDDLKNSTNEFDSKPGFSTIEFVQSILKIPATLNASGENTKDMPKTGEPQKPLVSEGITAPVAQATVKNRQDKKEKYEAPKLPVGGGIAALAAQAALKKSQENGEKNEIPKPPVGGGIAAIAAQAALKKAEDKAQKDSPPEPPIEGGIAALVAQAALKKAQENGEKNEIPKPPLGGGIAALAAQAALKKAQEKAKEDESPPPPLGGGIAALAAQAARKRTKEKAEEKSQETAREAGSLPPPLPPPTVGGIAALAAQAALQKSQEKAEEKSQEIVNENESPSLPKGGGIAALAAQAALKKSLKTKNDEKVVRPSTGEGIAVLAAQDALDRAQKSEKDELPNAPAGGIAALAAQAALEKAQKTIDEDPDAEEPPRPPSGGIAALAAQAALKKSKERADGPPAGGIAALAAQAALKKLKQPLPESIQASPPGGIAVLAAQAALKKPRESIDDTTRQAPGGGIATLAANAATKLESRVSRGIALNLSEESKERDSVNLSYSLSMLMTAVFETGILDAISNPRDVPALCCLHLLASSMQKHDSSLLPTQRDKELMPSHELATFSRRLLLRSLYISNQVSSIGMIGWLEYGSRNIIDRALILPLEVLQQLSCNMAAEKEWTKASDVLCSLWLRCEQNLPLCHPTTICSMLDLAGALSENQNMDSAKFIISQALDLCTSFLSEVESLFFDRRYFELYYNDPNRSPIVFFDDYVDAVDIMKAFSKQFQQELSRGFLEHLGRKHPIALLNHSLVGDSFLVLANCLSAGEHKTDKPNGAATYHRRSNEGASSNYFWWLAQSQYDLALRGWINLESLIHPNAASNIFSIARCLRELGKLQKAIKLLETLASCLEQKMDEELSMKKNARYPKTTSGHRAEQHSSSKRSFGRSSRPSFISRRQNATDTLSTQSCEREQTAAMCFWMMAVLTAEQNPDELGRNRALSLLHTASLTLQRVLNGSKESLDDQTYETCLDLYQRIEGEAVALFEPLERIPLAKDFVETTEENTNPKTPRKKRAPWEILTPMRLKREWTSPRSRIHRNKVASETSSSNTNTFFV